MNKINQNWVRGELSEQEMFIYIDIQPFTVPASLSPLSFTSVTLLPCQAMPMKVTRRFIKVQTVLMYVSGFRQGNNKLYHFRLIIIHNCTHINIKGDSVSQQVTIFVTMVSDIISSYIHPEYLPKVFTNITEKSFVFFTSQKRGLNFAVDQH